MLALGGGAILDDATRALLKGHHVVFLEVELADAVRRVGLDAPRPLLVGNPRARWRELMEQRRPLYTEVAVATVTTAGRTPDEVVAEIRAGLGTHAETTEPARTEPETTEPETTEPAKTEPGATGPGETAADKTVPDKDVKR